MLSCTAQTKLASGSGGRGTRDALWLWRRAGAPFHYLLGWELPPGTDAVGKFSWALDVDGTPRAADFTFHGPSSVYANGVARAWYFNFPGGMNAGTHTFTAHGFTPC
jgi:hypothetical protein